MSFIARPAAVLLFGALALQSAAADFDGTRPFICSVIDTNDCALGTPCIHGIAEDVNLPQFVKIDFKAKQISARGRTAPIQNSSRANGMLMIQGEQDQRAFSVTVAEDTGAFVAAVAGDGEGFMVFGACTLY
jgi:hypothetical protein